MRENNEILCFVFFLFFLLLNFFNLFIVMKVWSSSSLFLDSGDGSVERFESLFRFLLFFFFFFFLTFLTVPLWKILEFGS